MSLSRFPPPLSPTAERAPANFVLLAVRLDRIVAAMSVLARTAGHARDKHYGSQSGGPNFGGAAPSAKSHFGATEGKGGASEGGGQGGERAGCIMGAVFHLQRPS